MRTTTRRHLMPFGAEVLDNGCVRFQLWAPAANNVDICLMIGDGSSINDSCGQKYNVIPMEAGPDGWFNLTTDLAKNGTRYFFRINGNELVPDPASRFQPQDVHGPSEVVDPRTWHWQDTAWQGRPWEEAVIYELHVGSFDSRGNFAGVQQKLDYLASLGVTAIELMPVADFPGARNWGYDGTYLFAPDSCYGRPEDLKALVDAAHARGLMVFLDVVYNHFGPEGNYLHIYAPQFFKHQHHTPWGAAINYDGAHSHWVRHFFIHNALYWLEEYHLDGLRFDAVHTIVDNSRPDFLVELAESVRHTLDNKRHIHLVLENDHNASHYLARDAAHQPTHYVAQWNDDIHHALHVLLTGETGGYYQDYTDDPLRHLGRCLAEGFAFQGERSAYRENSPRGEASVHLPPTAFVSFLQNHDQVGNRTFSERIHTLIEPEPLHAALVLLLLAPSPPLLFMGQEWGSRQMFPFFCHFGPDLADKVAAGRAKDIARYAQFSGKVIREPIPNPMNDETFRQAVLDWDDCNHPEHQQWLDLHRELLELRRRELIPRLNNIAGHQQGYQRLGPNALSMSWTLGDGSELQLVTNLGDETLTKVSLPAKPILYTTHKELRQLNTDRLPPWSVIWYSGNQIT